MSAIEWGKAIKSCLLEMSDLEYQEKIWVKGEGPKVSSFVELICTLYDDYDFSGFLKYIRTHEYEPYFIEALYDLNDMIESFLSKKESDQPDKNIIKNAEWQKISKQARHIIEVFMP